MNRSFSKIRHIQETNLKLEQRRFNQLLESTIGDVRPLVKEDVGLTSDKPSKEGRNNPNWVNLVSKLKTVSYPPKILTFNSYDEPPIPSQSLNWGTASSPKGNYALAISSSDTKMPYERMSLFNSDDRQKQSEMHNWWTKKGYKTNGDDIMINYKDSDKLRDDINEFFKKFPPVWKINNGIVEQQYEDVFRDFIIYHNGICDNKISYDYFDKRVD